MGRSILENYNINFNFRTKVYISRKSGSSILRKIGKALLVGIILLTLIEILIDGFSLSIIKSKVVTIAMCFYIISNSRRSGYYKECVDNIKWNDKVLIFTRDVNGVKGKRKIKQEEITINLDNITKVEYSESLSVINIHGFPIEKISFLDSDKILIEDYRSKNKEKETMIYINGYEKEKLIDIIQNKTNLEIEYVE